MEAEEPIPSKAEKASVKPITFVMTGFLRRATMKRREPNHFSVLATILASLLLLGIGSTPLVHGQDDEVASIAWQSGPSTAQVGQIAEIEVPKGFLFAGAEDTKRLMEYFENPISGDELGLLTPESEEAFWFLVFEFGDSGYVSDDEKDSLDTDAMLEALIEGNEIGNQERKDRGWGTLKLVGWEREPNYNPDTNNLEWAIRLENEEREPIVNYNTRLLGRRGVMEVALVVDPTKLSAILPTYADLLNNYSFKPGQTYAEYREGDKIAKYGLAALITGGAVAVAAKTGLLAVLGKFLGKIWYVLVAGGAAIFRKLFGGSKTSTSEIGRS